MSKELENLDLALDLMERFIQPTIFKGLKSDVQAIEFKLNRLAKVEELLGLYQQIETDIPTKMLKRIRELEEELK